MGRQIIELVQVLVDRIYDCGYQQRCREDDIADVYKRLTDAEGQAKHWRQARQEAHEAGELMQAEIETLRTQLANAQQELSEQSMVANVETQQDAAAWQQQVDSANKEVSYLRAELAKANENRVDLALQLDKLRQQLDAAEAAVSLQRAGIERLRRFVGGVEGAFGAFQSISPDTCCDQIARCLAELEDSPTPVAEPARCPECERLQAELENANEHRTDLVLFVDKVRNSFRVWSGNESFFHSVSHALDQLDAGTIKPTPVAEPVDAEGGACPGT